jgi:hypothetical protein
MGERERERESTKRERVHKTIQEHIIHKIENKNTKQKPNIKRTLKDISRVIRK